MHNENDKIRNLLKDLSNDDIGELSIKELKLLDFDEDLNAFSFSASTMCMS
tara:strand:+ start:15043 stop:15195 length:153 start_codon:yes stop_codon:yes gene_type:complete